MKYLAWEISCGIEEFFDCTFPSDYIVDGKLACDKEDTVVIFSGRLISTNDRNSSEI